MHPHCCLARCPCKGSALRTAHFDADTVVPHCRHSARKALHASLHTFALATLLLGLAAVVASKLLSGYGHMYTLHSYLGAATILLAVSQVREPLSRQCCSGCVCRPGCRHERGARAQFGLGLGYFVFSPAARASLSQVHRPLGFAITVAGLTTVLVRAPAQGLPWRTSKCGLL